MSNFREEDKDAKIKRLQEENDKLRARPIRAKQQIDWDSEGPNALLTLITAVAVLTLIGFLIAFLSAIYEMHWKNLRFFGGLLLLFSPITAKMAFVVLPKKKIDE